MMLDSEMQAIDRSVAKTLAREKLDLGELRDTAQRLGRIGDAIAGLRAGQGRMIDRMVTFVCFAGGLRPSELLSRSREKRLSRGRFAIMWAARELMPSLYSFERIGESLGGLDHTSVLHGRRRAVQLRESDAEFRQLTDALIAHFSPKPGPAQEDQLCQQ